MRWVYITQDNGRLYGVTLQKHKVTGMVGTLYLLVFYYGLRYRVFKMHV